MKYDAALFATLAIIIGSVHASPAQERPRTSFTPSDPFVACVQKTFPKFPKEGKPTTEQLRACLPGAHPQAARELIPGDTKDDVDSPIESRGLLDTIPVLGEIMGLNQKSVCQDDNGAPTKLHDEFVWIEDVTKSGVGLCNDAMGIIKRTGLSEDGGIAYASKQFSNAHDEQSNYLHNGRKLLLTMFINLIPPLYATKQSLEAMAQGMEKLCSIGIERLMDRNDGCTSEVSWYISQKAKLGHHLAAVGGQLGMYFNGTAHQIGTIGLGFSQDNN